MKRKIALMLCVSVVLISLFSLYYIAKEIDHICTGEDCAVCAHIHAAQENLRRLTLKGGGAPSENHAAQLVLLVLVVLPMLVRPTPVSRKVRMDD